MTLRPNWAGVGFAIFTALASDQSFSQAQTSPLIPRGLRSFFVVDALLGDSEKLVRQKQSRSQIIALMDTSTSITSNSEVLMGKPGKVCSTYDTTICQDVSDKYAPSNVPLLFQGLYKISEDTIVTLGFNTGFESPKVSVTPSASLGGAYRWHLAANHTSHVIIEGNYWFGAVLTHRPCLDSYDREYFCPTLSAWSDFSYDPYPKSYYVRLTYEKVF